MTPEVVAADKRFEVRRAATLWRKAGVVDEATEQAVAAAYADDRLRTTRIFRVMFFGFTWFGFSSAYGLGSAFLVGAISAMADGSETSAFAFLSVLAGVAALVAAELLHGPRRLRRFGAEEACVWIGISHFVGGVLFLFDSWFDPSTAWLIGLGGWGVAGMATLAAWRWGTPATGFLAAAALFVALTQVPAAHLAWFAVSATLAWPLARLSVAEHISPQGRKRFRESFLVASTALYFSIHVEVVEARLFARIHELAGSSIAEAPSVLIGVSLFAMVAIPAAYLVAGLSRRHRPSIDLGLLMLLASAATFAFRAKPKPEWLFLLASGGVLLAAALVVRRLLAARPGVEWRGLTALPIADDRGAAAALETVAALAAFSPHARRLEEPGGFASEGGSFGGGGASAKF